MRRLLERGTVTMKGDRPGIVISHGTLIMKRVDCGTVVPVAKAHAVVWPLWRRLLVWAGFKQYAIQTGADGTVQVPVVSVRR